MNRITRRPGSTLQVISAVCYRGLVGGGGCFSIISKVSFLWLG